MPGLSEESLSSCPRNANSKAPQNLTQSIILDKMCLFLSTSSLCFLTAILWPSSSCVAMFTLPNMASLTELSMCALVFSCFLTFSDRCFISLTPLLLFLKAFSESEQTKLAILTGILLANSALPPPIITSLFTENVVKEGISASFAVKMFKAWISEKDANSVTSSLRKANLDKRLLELFPTSKQNVEHFSKYFNEAGLKELSDFLRVQQSLGTRKELQKELQERLSQQCPIREIVVYLKEEMKRNELQEQAVIGLLWTCLMNAVEWNKKEELVTEQALKHLKHYAPLLAVFSTQGQSELVLLLKIQEYCYDNIHFMKSFSKIVVLFYKADVLSEEAILKWYKVAHGAKGKSVFLEQMKKFVEWLQSAEEESESEGEEG
ncbi:eIF5-mimic protein 1 isoform X1 [Sparus aurata]|uniref:eIF5-mimic protein 1 isoform X1 n=1 Tax=Sparus aurata TaxID=8175 RepID=UPI0011C1A00A|nr:basic leucine zipper and W2 domain-containing protein 2 isoform X1 [Sparus aurata]